MHRILCRLALHVLAATLPVAAIPSQSPFRQVTTSGFDHARVVISPDGSRVAFANIASPVNRVGFVDVASGTEVTFPLTVRTAGLVWDATSRYVFYGEGAVLRAIDTSTATTAVVATTTSVLIHAGCMSSDNATIYCTTMAANGATTLATVARSTGTITGRLTLGSVLEQFRIDGSGRYLLVRSTVFAPAPNAFLRIDTNNWTSQTIFTGSSLFVSGSAFWLQGSTTIGLSTSPAIGRYPQYCSVGLGATPAPLTGLLHGTVTDVEPVADGWIAVETPNLAGSAPLALVPEGGGGLVYPDLGSSPTPGIGSTLSSISASPAARRLAVASNALPAHIYVLDLGQRYVRVAPRVIAGAPFQVSCTAATGEVAVVGFSLSVGTPRPVPGVLGLFAIASAGSPLVTAMLGIGPATITRTLAFANDPSLVGVRVYFQGAWAGAASAEFGPAGYFEIL